MASYNGHPSYRLWNLALWFANDEGLYRMAINAMRVTHTKDEAAKLILAELIECGVSETPDGARYTLSGVRYAIRGLE